MHSAAQVWTAQPNETLTSLAEKSGLWFATQDNMIPRPRTLQKYLKLKTLPKRPHLEPVLATADFVLAQYPYSSAALDLAAKLEMLRFTLNVLGKTPEVFKDSTD